MFKSANEMVNTRSGKVWKSKYMGDWKKKMQ